MIHPTCIQLFSQEAENVGMNKPGINGGWRCQGLPIPRSLVYEVTPSSESLSNACYATASAIFRLTEKLKGP
eukprot:2518924-Amphidinium_carterae.1